MRPVTIVCAWWEGRFDVVSNSSGISNLLKGREFLIHNHSKCQSVHQTSGHCAHMLLETICAGDPACFRRIKVRFASPVLLKDTLRVQAWRDGPGRVLFEADVGGKVVVSNAFFEFSEASAPASKL
mmetsp:Transcript_55209/g.91315  ORF Transcript_55209/g.91315 Transcript_55209/m.91315 type:complete len:126 (+) Transcript_55209:99-476(+)